MLRYIILFLFFVTLSYGQELSGSYSVGDSSSDDFATLKEAITELTNNGVNGPVIFGIRSGTYPVSELEIPTISGVSATNTIIFQPLDSGGTVVLQSSTYIIEVERSDYLTFNDLTFEIISDNGQNIGLHIKGSNHVNITNCLFNAMFEGSFYPNNRESFINLENLIVYTPTYTNYPVQHILIENNIFRDGNGAIFSIGGNNGKNEYIDISNNVFEGKSGNDIRMYYTNHVVINNNIFTGERTDDALEFRYIENGFEFRANQQYLEPSNFSPLYILDCMMDSNSPMFIKNNFFSSNRYISILRSGSLNIWNNSFYNGSGGYIMRLEQNLTNIALNNNIFRAGGSSLLYFSNDINFSEFDIDYNCYYTPDNANEFEQGTTSYNFDSWKTTFSLDANSILAKPNFLFSSDLHLNDDVLIDGKGKVLSDVVVDIDGEVRDATTPDIGADEFDLDLSSLVDLELMSIQYHNNDPCDLLDPIQILVTNHSTFLITSFDLEWWLNESFMGKTTISENIEANNSKTIDVGNYPFAANTTYNLRFKLSLPNGETDNDLSNNELTQDYTHFNVLQVYQEKDTSCSDTYTLYVRNQPRATVSWSTGENTNFINVPAGTYSVTVISANGCSLTRSIVVE